MSESCSPYGEKLVLAAFVSFRQVVYYITKCAQGAGARILHNILECCNIQGACVQLYNKNK